MPYFPLVHCGKNFLLLFLLLPFSCHCADSHIRAFGHYWFQRGDSIIKALDEMTLPVRSGRSTSQGKERSVGVKMTQQMVISYGGKIGGGGVTGSEQGELNVETKH